jgi:hypothetical protein
MFISTDYLAINYGVDNQIARFFVDREPPADNLYWHEKLLYLRPAVGYLFIPLIVDLLFKSGLDKQRLLSARFVETMEQIGHISALEETKEISAGEALTKCSDLVATKTVNQEWLAKINEYFYNDMSEFKEYASPFKALHRGDLFLFSLAVLEFPVRLFTNVLQQWFALITTLLLLDDAEDLKTDIESGEENAFLEAGLGAEDLQKIKELTANNFSKISAVNPSMSLTLQRQFDEKMKSFSPVS